MSELPPKPEHAPPLTKEAVIERLRENPQELGPYLEWIEMRKREIEAIKDHRATAEADNDLAFEMGGICREAGLLESARDNFEQAAEQARHMRDGERYWRAWDALDALPKPS